MALIIDIETVARELSDEEIAGIKASIKPPKAITLSKSKEKWMEEKAPLEFEKKMSRLALDPFYNQIIAISWRYHGVGDTQGAEVRTSPNEKVLLELFIEHTLLIKGAKYEIYPFVGVNILNFDLPIISLHMMKLGIDPLGIDFMPSKYNRKKVVDLMTLFGGAWKSTEALCAYFNIDTSNNPITGAQVQECWDNGDLDTISEHCRCDVDETYQLWDYIHKFAEAK